MRTFDLCRAIRALDLPIIEKAILTQLALATHSKFGTAWPRIGVLAEWVGCSRRSAERAIAELERRGFLRINRRSGVHSVYRLYVEDLDVEVPEVVTTEEQVNLRLSDGDLRLSDGYPRQGVAPYQHIDQPNENSQEKKPPPFGVGEEVDDMTTMDEVLGRVDDDFPSDKAELLMRWSGKETRPGNLRSFWKECLACLRPHLRPVPEPKPRQLGFLKAIAKDWGPDTYRALADACHHWGDLCEYVRRRAGARTPGDPDLGFLAGRAQEWAEWDRRRMRTADRAAAGARDPLGVPMPWD